MKNRIPVWIDTDLSIGIEYPDKPGHFHDIDDALALIASFNSQLIEVRGVSATFGNIDTDTSFRLVKELTRKFGPKGLPVIKGASGPIKNGVLPEQAAADAIAEELKRGPLTLISIGSATNIGILIKKYPHLIDKVETLLAMAGSKRNPQNHFFVGPKQIKPFRSMNFEADVEAWEIILASNVPITFAPFDVSHKLWITPQDVKEMKNGAGATGKYLAPHMEQWANEWIDLWGCSGFNPFDVIAPGYILAPEFFTSVELPVGIMEYPDDTIEYKSGEPPVLKPYLIASDTEPSILANRRATFLSDVNEGFKPFLMDLLKGQFFMGTQVLGFSHINVVVDDVEKAAEFYQRALGFQMAYNGAGGPIDFVDYCAPAFAKDAGFLDGSVNVDVRFVRHPQAGICLELMKYKYPEGSQEVHFFKTNDMGGPRHIALEVDDIAAVFTHLKKQPEVRMINSSKKYGIPIDLEGTDISFFYWLDPYGVQWEMESGRPVAYGRDIGL
ncbi:MAG: nucleoside hydrolase [Desulfotalea sp.]